MSERDDLIAANAAFYAAVNGGDLQTMTRLWAEGDTVSCIHPGWPAIVGQAAVLGSWRDIFRNQRGLNITCEAPHALVTGEDGRVLCVEIVGGAALAATNGFRRIAGVWRMVHHQAGQIMTAGPATTGDNGPSTQIH